MNFQLGISDTGVEGIAAWYLGHRREGAGQILLCVCARLCRFCLGLLGRHATTLSVYVLGFGGNAENFMKGKCGSGAMIHEPERRRRT